MHCTYINISSRLSRKFYFEDIFSQLPSSFGVGDRFSMVTRGVRRMNYEVHIPFKLNTVTSSEKVSTTNSKTYYPSSMLLQQ